MTDDLEFFIEDTIKEIMVTYDHLRQLELRLKRLRAMEAGTRDECNGSCPIT